MNNAFEIYRMTPCADLVGITLHGHFSAFCRETMKSGLERLGFKLAVLGGNGVIVGSKDGVSLIIGPLGDFSLSRISDEGHGRSLLMGMLGSASNEPKSL